MPSLLRACLLAAIALGTARPAQVQGQADPATEPPRTIFLVGDSTVKNGSDNGKDQLWGWGKFLGERIDPARYRVENRALGGRSSRTYRTEGLWAKVVEKLRPGDVVLIQFGHNDGGPMFADRARASIKGTGEETATGRVGDKPEETVHTYGWYLREYAREAKAKGATPIILSPVPRNMWDAEGKKVARASKDYGKWAAEVAQAEGVPFVDLNALAADRYEAIGREQVARDAFTAKDHTHTTEFGARLNAECVAAGLRALADQPVAAAVLAEAPTARP